MENYIELVNRTSHINEGTSDRAIIYVVNGVPYIRTSGYIYAFPTQEAPNGESSGGGYFIATEEITTFTQTYSTADATLSAYTPNDQSAALTTLGATTDIASMADLNTLRVAYENLRLFTEDLAKLVNSVIDNEQALGIAG